MRPVLKKGNAWRTWSTVATKTWIGWVGAAVLQVPQTSEGKASCELQLSLSEQLVPRGPVKPQVRLLPPPTNLAPVGEA